MESTNICVGGYLVGRAHRVELQFISKEELSHDRNPWLPSFQKSPTRVELRALWSPLPPQIFMWSPLPPPNISFLEVEGIDNVG